MPSPVTLRASFPDLFGTSALPALEEMFWSNYEQFPSLRSSLCKIVTRKSDIYQYSEVHDLSLHAEVPEGSEYTFEAPAAGANKTLRAVKYGLGVSISEEMVDDGKFDMIGQMLAMMGRSARESQEILALNLINNGWTSTLTADGLSLFNTAHTLPSGLTYRNTLSTQADLSPTSLNQALADMETQTIGDSGIKYMIKPRILLVSPQLKRYATEIVGSDLKADTSDNNLNPFKSDGLTVVSSPHFTDEDAWVLLSEPDRHGLRIFARSPVATKGAGPDSIGFTTDSILYKSRFREDVGAFHPKGVFGVQGA